VTALSRSRIDQVLAELDDGVFVPVGDPGRTRVGRLGAGFEASVTPRPRVVVDRRPTSPTANSVDTRLAAPLGHRWSSELLVEAP
jgi:hypothetical protein